MFGLFGSGAPSQMMTPGGGAQPAPGTPGGGLLNVPPPSNLAGAYGAQPPAPAAPPMGAPPQGGVSMQSGQAPNPGMGALSPMAQQFMQASQHGAPVVHMGGQQGGMIPGGGASPAPGTPGAASPFQDQGFMNWLRSNPWALRAQS